MASARLPLVPAEELYGIQRVVYLDDVLVLCGAGVGGGTHVYANTLYGAETFNKAPVGVYFGTPGIDAHDPYFGGMGPRRTGCISCGKCNIGCGHNAKNKLTTNYLYLAEKIGAEVHELHQLYDVVPLTVADSRCTRVTQVGRSEPSVASSTHTPASR